MLTSWGIYMIRLDYYCVFNMMNDKKNQSYYIKYLLLYLKL